MSRKLRAVAAVAALVTVGLTAPNATATTTSSHYFNLTKIYFDSPGSDSGTNASVNHEYFVVKNITKATHALTGWTVSDRQHHRYTYPKVSLGAGASIYVHTGKGSAVAHTRYWGLGYYVWNNTGDAATLRGPAGTVWDVCSYTAANDPVKTC